MLKKTQRAILQDRVYNPFWSMAIRTVRLCQTRSRADLPLEEHFEVRSVQGGPRDHNRGPALPYKDISLGVLSTSGARLARSPSRSTSNSSAIFCATHGLQPRLPCSIL